ncbi:MAG: LOG family protein [Candidatus Methylomirabilota bacterium]
MSKAHGHHGRPPKAYKNAGFLGSRDARPLRILAEFLEPMSRFRQHQVKDTIAFFGSARILPAAEAASRLEALHSRAGQPDAPAPAELERAETGLRMARYYEDAVELARLLTEWSGSLKDNHRFLICSGGGPGIMEAANKGASLAGGKSIGLNISIPFEQLPNPFISPELNFEFHYFFMRKFWFAYLAKALVVFPGGFGTMDELMEMLTLLQTGKIKKKVTVLLYGSDFWREVLNLPALLRYGVISPEDTALFHQVDTPQAAFEILTAELMKNYHVEEE